MSGIGLLPVILSAGAGTRGWPPLRGTSPWQLHALTGAVTMLQDNVLRARDLGVGNAVHGQAVLEGSTDALVFASSRLVAGARPDNGIVVAPLDDALLAGRGRGHDVKRTVTRFKSEGHAPAVDTHRKVHRARRWYDAVDAGDRFRAKRIVAKPGASLSPQIHHHRVEHWIVVRGTAEVANGDKVKLLSENESTYIPLGHVHRLANPGKVPLEIIESRCSPAAISAKTTSCVSKIPMAVALPRKARSVRCKSSKDVAARLSGGGGIGRRVRMQHHVDAYGVSWRFFRVKFWI